MTAMRVPIVYDRDFFVVGGTVRPDAPSYVQRPADEELFQLARAGEFSYVLATRQMGKSSLMMRTDRRLQESGIKTVKIDLTFIGTKDVTADQWYLGLMTAIKRRLRLSLDPETWWIEREGLSTIQRFISFLRDELLEEVPSGIVIFIDEIDSTLNLDFTDDFFAAIRATYNARAADPEFDRLTFILLGVATPADLIKDPARTPFNIGKGIDLQEFDQMDAQILQHGLTDVQVAERTSILDRILYWTNGHPYLTQKICKTVAENKHKLWTDKRIDTLVEAMFLSEEGRQEENLQFISNNINKSPNRRQILELYRQVYRGKPILEDKRSLDQNYLKLSGLVRPEKGHLRIRNNIYREAFNLEWIKANLPTDVTRRIAIGATLVTLILISLLGYSLYRQTQTTNVALAQSYITAFEDTTDSTLRLDSLAKLFAMPVADFNEQAETLFHSLSLDEQVELFTKDTEDLQPQVRTVVRNVYIDLPDSEAGNMLLRAMANALEQSKDLESVISANEIARWLDGRDAAANNQLERAMTAYSNAIDLRSDNPATHFERALILAKLEEFEGALADLEIVLELDETWLSRVQDELIEDQALYDIWWANIESHRALIGLIPTPTLEPTSTSEAAANSTLAGVVAQAALQTATPEPTTPAAFTATSTPEPTQTFTATPLPTSTDTATSVPSPTPTPTSTFTFTPVPTATSTNSPTATSTRTPQPTSTPVFAADANKIEASTVTNTPTPTASPTATSTATSTVTSTPSATITSTTTRSPTMTPTPTATELPTRTPTATRTPIRTASTSVYTPKIIYARSLGQTLDLGLVSSRGSPFAVNLPRQAASPAWSPDGGKIAFFGQPGINSIDEDYHEGEGLWLTDSFGDNPQLMVKTDHIKNIAWSLDGTKIAFELGYPGLNAEIVVINAIDGRPISRFSGQQPAWTRDHQHLVVKACFESCGLWQVDIDGTNGRPITREGSDSYPSLSPIAPLMTFASERSGNWEIYLMRLDDGFVQQLTEGGGVDTTPVFRSDGKEIYFRSNSYGPNWQVVAFRLADSQSSVIIDNIGQTSEWGWARPAAH